MKLLVPLIINVLLFLAMLGLVVHFRSYPGGAWQLEYAVIALLVLEIGFVLLLIGFIYKNT